MSQASPASSSAVSIPPSTSNSTRKLRKPTIPRRKPRLAALKGKIAIANARLAYQDYKRLFAGDALAEAGSQARQATAAAVGLDRDQKQGLQRRSRRRGTDRQRYGQHRPSGNS